MTESLREQIARLEEEKRQLEIRLNFARQIQQIQKQRWKRLRSAVAEYILATSKQESAADARQRLREMLSQPLDSPQWG